MQDFSLPSDPARADSRSYASAPTPSHVPPTAPRPSAAKARSVSRAQATSLRPRATSLSRQSAWLWLTPIITVSLFAAVMAASFFILTRSDVEQRQQSLYRDIEWAQQTMRLAMKSKEERLIGLAREVGLQGLSESEFSGQAREIIANNPELVMISWIDSERRARWLVSSHVGPPETYRRKNQQVEDPAPFWAFDEARVSQRVSYTGPFLGADNDVYVEMHAPIVRQSRFIGTIGAIYSVNRMLMHLVPRELAERYKVSLVDEGGNTLASTSPRTIHDANLSYELAMDPPGHGIRLRAYAFGARREFIDQLLWTLVAGLSAVIMWSLILLARHTSRRAQAEFERDRLFTLSQDVLCVLDPDNKLARVNPAFSRLMNLPTEHAVNTPLLQLIHPDDRQRVQTLLDKLSVHNPDDDAIAFEARCGSGDGRWRWLSWRITIDLHAMPDEVMLYAVAHDVTERKNAEAALAAETAFRRAMENSIAIGMRVIDLEGRITYVNPAFCRMTGWSEKELVDQVPPFCYWPDAYIEEHWTNLQLLLRSKSPVSGFEVRIKRRDGSEFDARMYVSPLIELDGHQSGWMSSITDITEPKRIREELAAAQERFTTVLEALDAAVAVVASTDTDGDRLLFANRFYRTSFGNHARAFGELTSLGSSLATAQQAMQNGGSHHDAAMREIYAGSVGRWFDVRTRQIVWVDGSLVTLLIATDITERREAQELSRQQEERLQHTGRLVTMGEMASSLAHELNQPLTAIANYSMGTSARVKAAQRRGETLDASALLDALGKTAAQAERAGQVIKRIRDFVKRSEPKRERTNVRKLADDALGLVDAEAAKRRVAIHVDLPADLPDVDVDPILIAQVLLNLLKNAIDAQGPAGRGEVRMRGRIVEDMVEITVSDRGPGVAPERIERLFEPFYTTKTDGMGMGLNICRSVVEHHQGRLWYEPNPGGGAIFILRLPAPMPKA